jgi:hypothetical protein
VEDVEGIRKIPGNFLYIYCRDGLPAECILFYTQKDRRRLKALLKHNETVANRIDLMVTFKGNTSTYSEGGIL